MFKELLYFCRMKRKNDKLSQSLRNAKYLNQLLDKHILLTLKTLGVSQEEIISVSGIISEEDFQDFLKGEKSMNVGFYVELYKALNSILDEEGRETLRQLLYMAVNSSFRR